MIIILDGCIVTSSKHNHPPYDIIDSAMTIDANA